MVFKYEIVQQSRIQFQESLRALRENMLLNTVLLPNRRLGCKIILQKNKVDLLAILRRPEVTYGGQLKLRAVRKLDLQRRDLCQISMEISLCRGKLHEFQLLAAACKARSMARPTTQPTRGRFLNYFTLSDVFRTRIQSACAESQI